MKKILLAVVAGALLLGVSNLQAQSVTNLVQQIKLSLTAYEQDDSSTNGVVVTDTVKKSKHDTGDFVQFLGEMTGNSFSSKAKLLLITQMPDGEGAVVVRDGTNEVDVSEFFSFDRSSSVHSSTTNTSTDASKSTEYLITALSLHDGGVPISVHFDLQGFTTIKSSTIIKNGVIVGTAHQIAANLSGLGDNDGSLLIINGTMGISGTTLEVQ